MNSHYTKLSSFEKVFSNTYITEIIFKDFQPFELINPKLVSRIFYNAISSFKPLSWHDFKLRRSRIQIEFRKNEHCSMEIDAYTDEDRDYFKNATTLQQLYDCLSSNNDQNLINRQRMEIRVHFEQLSEQKYFMENDFPSIINNFLFYFERMEILSVSTMIKDVTYDPTSLLTTIKSNTLHTFIGLQFSDISNMISNAQSEKDYFKYVPNLKHVSATFYDDHFDAFNNHTYDQIGKMVNIFGGSKNYTMSIQFEAERSCKHLLGSGNWLIFRLKMMATNTKVNFILYPLSSQVCQYISKVPNMCNLLLRKDSNMNIYFNNDDNYKELIHLKKLNIEIYFAENDTIMGIISYMKLATQAPNLEALELLFYDNGDNCQKHIVRECMHYLPSNIKRLKLRASLSYSAKFARKMSIKLPNLTYLAIENRDNHISSTFFTLFPKLKVINHRCPKTGTYIYPVDLQMLIVVNCLIKYNDEDPCECHRNGKLFKIHSCYKNFRYQRVNVYYNDPNDFKKLLEADYQKKYMETIF
uniref:F-box domain-containing protein n=1 Tax=Rhabditophanes sp. KR3021 TaxID=114890 RepID=A0AC35UA31_9BILA